MHRPPPTRNLDPATLPAEVRFLLNVVAASLGGSEEGVPPPQPDPALDWTKLPALVRHHRLEPLIGPALAPDVAIPDGQRRILAAMRRDAAIRSMRLAGELARIARAFADAGVEMLALKGPALSVLLYGDPSRRFCRDIDLLVRPEVQAEARRVLAGCGYGTTPDAVVACANAVQLLHAGNHAPVELHVRLAADERLFPVAALAPFDSAVSVEIGGTRVPTLGLDAAMVYAAFHGAGHYWGRLYWLADIAAAARRPDIDWPRIAKLAQRMGVDRHLALAARLSGTLLEQPLPGLPPLGSQGMAAVRRAEAILPVFLSKPWDTDLDALRAAGRFRVLRCELALHHRVKALWALALVRLKPSDTDHTAVPLPKKLDCLYFAIRFIRVAWSELSCVLQGRRR